ncbi:M23 family metallopeptidase [Planotetraspora phitsanulokensis]|nr:M23 family metallopeptidase [Planotetraspora phitsanulokensis]
MRSGKLALLAGAGCLAAACSGPSGDAAATAARPSSSATSTSTSTGGTSAAGTPSGAAATARPANGKPAGSDPVRVLPPKVSPFTYVFPVKGCRTTYTRKLLAGLPKSTIWAGKGCAFVAPVDGVVREVNTESTWKPDTDVGADREGRFVTILGKDGVLYLGGHLYSVTPGLKPGAKVRAGQRLGSIGNSGNALDTAANLYFGISWPTDPKYWWIRRGMVEPWTFLDAWRSGNRTLSPKQTVINVRKRVGALPKCTVLCVPRPVQKTDPQSTQSPPADGAAA